MATKSNPGDGLSDLTLDSQICAMKINLIDDTALIETTSIGNGRGKAKKFLGSVEKTKRKEAGGDIAMTRTAAIGNGRGKGKRFVGFAENWKKEEFGGDKAVMRTDSIINGRGKGKRILGFAEIMNKQELGRDKGLLRTDSIGNGRANEKRIMGFGENLKRQEVVGDSGLTRTASVGNGRAHEKGILGFAESVEKKETDEDASLMETASIGNGRGKERKFMGFAESVEHLETDEDIELIETACGVENGFGTEIGFMGLADYQKSNGKRMKRIKGQNKCARITENEKDLTTDMVESQSEYGCEKIGAGTKFPYSRKELEALRFANEEDQKKKWDEIYRGLGTVVTREYDSLVDCNLHLKKHTGLNFDPRLNFSQRAAAREILDAVAANGRENHQNIFVH